MLVTKPLPPASEKELYDQFWYGDPYSDTSTYDRNIMHALQLLETTVVERKVSGYGFDFYELRKGSEKPEYVRVYTAKEVPFWRESASYGLPESRFGLAWEDISNPSDRKYWIAGSRLSVVDLSDNSVVAERIGFFIEAGFGSRAGQRRPWQSSRGENTTCPPVSRGGYSDNWFIFRVLKPLPENRDGK